MLNLLLSGLAVSFHNGGFPCALMRAPRHWLQLVALIRDQPIPLWYRLANKIHHLAPGNVNGEAELTRHCHVELCMVDVCAQGLLFIFYFKTFFWGYCSYCSSLLSPPRQEATWTGRRECGIMEPVMIYSPNVRMLALEWQNYGFEPRFRYNVSFVSTSSLHYEHRHHLHHHFCSQIVLLGLNYILMGLKERWFIWPKAKLW